MEEGKKGGIKGPSFRKWKNKVLYWQIKRYTSGEEDGVKCLDDRLFLLLRSHWSVVKVSGVFCLYFHRNLKMLPSSFPLASPSPLCLFYNSIFFSWHLRLLRLAQSCRPGRTPNGERFYRRAELAISSHISSTLVDTDFLPGMLLLLSSAVRGRAENAAPSCQIYLWGTQMGIIRI